MPFLLVFLLSGLPAIAVVCDLLLCAETDAAAPQACHEHAPPASGESISAVTHGCTHLADTSPFVAAGFRQAVPSGCATLAATSSGHLLTASSSMSHVGRAGPRPLFAHSSPTLRI